MSDTSHDSMDSMERPIEDTCNAKPNEEVQIRSLDENIKHIQTEPRSQEEIENEEFVKPAIQLSHALGRPDVTTMVTKIDNVHHWLLELGQDPSQEEIRAAKQSVQNHEDLITEMRHIVRMPILRAVRVNRFIKAFVSDSTNRLTDRAVKRVLSGGSVGSTALKYLLSKQNFKSDLISKVEREITGDARFPFTDPDTLNKKISKSVDVALGSALRIYAQKKFEKQHRKKYEAALRKSIKDFETDMKDSGL
ncbi:hypothetical protein KCU65_g1630, partial [Aureobasidium melanogenum]